MSGDQLIAPFIEDRSMHQMIWDGYELIDSFDDPVGFHKFIAQGFRLTVELRCSCGTRKQYFVWKKKDKNFPTT